MHNMQLQHQLGFAAVETQEHCMGYSFQTVNKSRDQNVLYAHIFGTLQQQLNITKVLSLLLEEREDLIRKRGATSLPVGSLYPDSTVHIL